MCQVSSSYSLLLPCLCLRVMHCISCHHVLFICIRIRLMHPSISPLSILHSGAPMSSGGPFYLFSCAGVKNFRIGPRLAMQPWFTTGRPPVKFRAIWSSFDTPMVNQGTVKASCVAAQHPSKLAQTHLNLSHHLERLITIAWPQTALHLELPSSLYLYK